MAHLRGMSQDFLKGIRMRRCLVAALILSLSALFPATLGGATNIETGTSTAEATLKVCVDQRTQKPLDGDIELMLVMDNSKSLQTNDSEGKRFNQVRTMLKSVHDRISKSKKPRDIRFSFITFANRATVQVPLSAARVLTSENIDAIAKQVEVAAPGNQENTDYVAAMEAAIAQMRGAPARNCRVIVWFTDGAYWPSTGAAGNSVSGGTLRERVCAPGGFSDQLRQLNVNIFPLYIEPRDPPSKDDPTASRDVMAHLTGDQDAFAEAPYRAGDPCGALPSHVGEVLAAADVNQLGQFFKDLVNIFEGGVAIACPTKNGTVESKLLPAGRYISEISIVKYDISGRELTPRDLVASQPSGETASLDKFFQGNDGRYAATDAARELTQGWRIEGSGVEHCLRAFKREGLAVQVARTGANAAELTPVGASASWLEGEDLVSDENDTAIPVVRLGPKASCSPVVAGFATDPTSLSGAFDQLSGKARGVICVDPTGSEVFSDGVALDVSRKGEPLIACDGITLRRTGADEFISSDRKEKSTECVVDFRGSGATFVGLTSNFVNLLTAQESNLCNFDSAKSVVAANNRNGEVRISVTAVIAKNRETKCGLPNKSVNFRFADANGTSKIGTIPFSIELNLQPEPDRPAALIATILTVLMLLAAALAILRRMTIQAAALLAPAKMCSVRFGVQAARRPDGRVTISVENRMLRDVQIDMERVNRAVLDGSESKLVVRDLTDELVIKREVPPLRMMLREPWAWVDDTRTYFVHPKGRRAPASRNLVAPFREAVIALDDGRVKGADNERAISVWVIKQKGSPEGDQISIEELLKENCQAIIDELLEELESKDGGESGAATGLPTNTPPELEPPQDQESRSLPLPPDW